MRANAARILAHVPQGTRLIAVVKANGYGHGAVPVARAALGAGATWLAVATLEEADTAPEEHGSDMHLQLVEEPGSQTLLNDARSTCDRDVLPARGRLRLLERGLNAVRDEDERRST